MMNGRAGSQPTLDLRSSGAILRILVLMAMADGVLAPKETLDQLEGGTPNVIDVC